MLGLWLQEKMLLMQLRDRHLSLWMNQRLIKGSISVSWGGDGGGRLQVHPELGCAITEGKQQGPLTRVRPQPGAGDASKTHVVVTLKMPLAGDRCRQVIHRVE